MRQEMKYQVIGFVVIVAVVVLLLPFVFRHNAPSAPTKYQAPPIIAKQDNEMAPVSGAMPVKISDNKDHLQSTNNVPVVTAKPSVIDVKKSANAATSSASDTATNHAGSDNATNAAKVSASAGSNQDAASAVNNGTVSNVTNQNSNLVSGTSKKSAISSQGAASSDVSNANSITGSGNSNQVVSNVTQQTTSVTAANPKAWIVQAASFKSGANADKLVSQLQSQKYKAFSYRGEGQTYTRVFVGPVLESSQARHIQTALKSSDKLDGMVLKYNPLWV